MVTRLEKVRLELESNFSRVALEDAVAAKTLAKSLDSSGGSARAFSRDIDRSSSKLDSMSGRLGLAVRAIGALGPATIPVVAGTTAALAGLAAQAGSVVLAGGAVVFAFKGVGDALDAFNKAKLDPTAANLDKARAAMDALPASARQAVRAMSGLGPVVFQLKDAAASGFFPGFIEGLDDLRTRAPQAEAILHSIADAAGDLFASGAADIAGPRWQAFFDFIEREAAPTLMTFGRSVGNVTHGLAGLMMAVNPLSTSFSAGLLRASEAFDKWANSVSETDGFKEFLQYVEQAGPEVMDALGSLANALLQIGEAAAPLGGPILHIITMFADAIAALADSPLGPPIMAAVSALSALSLVQSAFGKTALTSWLTAARGAEGYIAQLSVARTAFAGLGKGAALVAGLSFATSDLGQQMGLTNTALFASMGLMAGPWGAAIGAGVGLMVDYASSTEKAADSVRDFATQMEQAAASGSLTGKALTDAQQKYDELAAKVKELNDSTGLEAQVKVGDSAIPQILSSAKNGLEGLFGQSDDEERTAALKRAKKAMDDAAAAAEREAQAEGYASDAVRRHTEALNAQHAAMAGALNSALAYEQSILTASKAVKDNGRVVDANGKALRGHRQAAIDSRSDLYGLAGAWNKLNDDAGQTPAQQARAMRSFEATARAMGFGKDQAHALALELFNMPKKQRVDFIDNAAEAKARVVALKLEIARLHGKAITITVNRKNGADTTTYYPDGSFAVGQGGRIARAHGGPIYGPGTETSDSVPAMLSHGEYVVRAAAVRKYGMGFFERANQMRLASGGHVGSRGGDDATRENTRALREDTADRKQHRAKVTARLEALNSAISSLKSTVAGRYRSDLFGAPSNIWATGQDANSILQGDIRDSQAAIRATAALKKKGLNGGALTDLLSNADLATIQDYAGMSKDQLAHFEWLYNRRQRLSGQAGSAAGNAVYGKQLAGLQREVKGLRHDVKKSAKDMGREAARTSNDAAGRGKRNRR